jgi:hypothetical protein
MCAWLDGVPSTLDELLDNLRASGLHKIPSPVIHPVGAAAESQPDSESAGTSLSPGVQAAIGVAVDAVSTATPPVVQEKHCAHLGGEDEATEINPLVRLLATSVWQSNYLPTERLVCPEVGCGGRLEQHDEFPRSVSGRKKPGSKQMVEPDLLRCEKCMMSCTESSLVDAWITSRLGPDAVCPDDERFANAVTVGNPLFKGGLDGLSKDLTPSWVTTLTENDVALLSLRAREFQKHSFRHTTSCYKSKSQNKGRCRYVSAILIISCGMIVH